MTAFTEPIRAAYGLLTPYGLELLNKTQAYYRSVGQEHKMRWIQPFNNLQGFPLMFEQNVRHRWACWKCHEEIEKSLVQMRDLKPCDSDKCCSPEELADRLRRRAKAREQAQESARKREAKSLERFRGFSNMTMAERVAAIDSSTPLSNCYIEKSYPWYAIDCLPPVSTDCMIDCLCLECQEFPNMLFSVDDLAEKWGERFSEWGSYYIQKKRLPPWYGIGAHAFFKEDKAEFDI